MGADSTPHDVCLAGVDLGSELPRGPTVRTERHLHDVAGPLHGFHPQAETERPTCLQVLYERANRSAEPLLVGTAGATKVQFLEAADQENVDAPTAVAGIPVASLPDLLASKLNALVTRAPAALRDYFDLKAIEEKTQLRVEEGLGIFVRRFRPASPRSYLVRAVRALGYMGDVEDDNLLPRGSFAEVEAYWQRRQPEILRHLGRTAFWA